MCIRYSRSHVRSSLAANVAALTALSAAVRVAGFVLVFLFVVVVSFIFFPVSDGGIEKPRRTFGL